MSFSILKSLFRFQNLAHLTKPAIYAECGFRREVRLSFGPRTLTTSIQEVQTTTPDQNIDNTEEIIKTIGKGDPTKENKLRVLMLEVEVLRQEGRRAPSNSFMKERHWDFMLNLDTRSSRFKYLAYLWKNQMLTESKKLKKLESKKAHDAKLEEEKNNPVEDNSLKYGLTKNAMLIRIYDKSLNQFYNHRLYQAMLYGRKLIFDCSYDNHMTRRECVNTANQLTLLFADNRLHKEPFDLHLVNCDMESHTMKQLFVNIPTLKEPDFPLSLHTESYLDIFPKEKLVYLTPHCREDLVYNPDDIYIVGCMVDKVKVEPISLAKAKENKIRMARLPLDRYLQWKGGSGKSLTIDQMCKILLDLNHTEDWNVALKHVPRRKLIYPTNGEKISNPVNKILFDYESRLNKGKFGNKNVNQKKSKFEIKSLYDD